MRSPETVIIRPLLTEKGSGMRETGGQPAGSVDTENVRPKIMLEVSKDANKIEIRNAVEKLWKVRVVDVHTQVVAGKKRRLGRYVGRKTSWKKALVTLAPGQSIEFFEGV
jgi:large subunit ribosomal protein L23